MTRRSLILAGGGLKVAFQAGVLQVWLDEAGLTFDHADGASGGVFNLAMYCQGMTGTQMADNWRRLHPLRGTSINWKEVVKLPVAQSLLTYDAFRANVLRSLWGLDWDAIRATDKVATFNLYDFTALQTVVLTADQMDEDRLVSAVSLPMWFPPVVIDGHHHIDAVYSTDANLDEAIARGADELWVIWTVSTLGRWRGGFVSEYFQIIEASSNSRFRDCLSRVEENNAAVARGESSAYGRHIEVKLLQAEVPLHYLFNFTRSRMAHGVELGVETARRWCAEQGIALPVSVISAEALAASHDMVPVEGSVELDVPAGVLGPAFFRANRWPWWNGCMAYVRNRELRLGDHLIWVFEPIRRWYLYLFPAIATIVELEPDRKVTWEVTALPGFYARHTYTITDLGGGRSRFSSWEQGMGPSFRATRAFWLAHFTFVRDRSLQGARLLEAAYRIHGHLDDAALPRRRGVALSLTDLLGAFELLRVQAVQLGEGVWTVLGGGGNTVVVEAGREALVIDPKFPPFDRLLQRWIDRHVGLPVTTVVNTHHHYDHTFGNPRFPSATVVADARVPELMRRRDGGFWRSHPAAMPDASRLVTGDTTLDFGETSLRIHPAGQAHTAGDAWVRLTRAGREYVVTGDIGCFGHYPFFDRGEGGADLAGWSAAAHHMAAAPGQAAATVRDPKTAIAGSPKAATAGSPKAATAGPTAETAGSPKAGPAGQATVVPGHGAVGTAADLERLGVFLDFLARSVRESAAAGLDEAATVRNVDLSSWRLGVLPVFRYGELVVTGRTAVRRAFQLVAAHPQAAPPTTTPR